MRALFITLLMALAALALPAVDEPARIRVGDALEVTVLGFECYSGKHTVVTDGTISGPGFGRVVALGRTLGEVQKQIRNRLKEYVQDPQVFVSFGEQAPQFVYLVPGGKTPFTPELDLRKALSSVTLPDTPDKLEAVVYRDGAVLRRVSVKALLDGASDAWNGPLAPSDIVVTNSTLTMKVWFVDRFGKLGEARLPAGTTLDQAVASAGGIVTQPALVDKAQIVVRRGDKTFEFGRELGPDACAFVLEPGDTLSVRVPRELNVSVIGQVGAQGPVTVLEGAQPIDAIAAARGVLSAGTLKGVLVFRRGEAFRLDLSTVRQGAPAPSFALQDQDMVVVPENLARVYVMGQVRSPGRYAIPDRETLRAADALALAGGLAGRGTNRRVTLLRAGKDGVYRPTLFNLDEYMKDGKLESNPELMADDLLLFGEPRGLTMETASRVASAILVVQSFSD